MSTCLSFNFLLPFVPLLPPLFLLYSRYDEATKTLNFLLSFFPSRSSLFLLYTRYDEATKTLSQIEAAASQIADWTKIATDAVRFAQRDIEARVATAVLARIDVMSVQDKVVYLAGILFNPCVTLESPSNFQSLLVRHFCSLERPRLRSAFV